jgi:hypothetical protein
MMGQFRQNKRKFEENKNQREVGHSLERGKAK